MNFKFLSKKTLIITILVSLPLVMALLVVIFSRDTQETTYNTISDILTQQVRNELEREKGETLALAAALSNSHDLSDALVRNDREKGISFLNTMDKSLLFGTTRTPHRFQIATKDLTVFARSWDPSSHGDKLDAFRKGLIEVRNTKKPLVSVEIGKKINIKAIAPIIDKGKFLGTVEVITDFDQIVAHFKEKELSLMILMDEKYLSTAKWMTSYPQINGFVVGHKSYDHLLFEELSRVNFYLLLHTRLILSDHYLIASEPLRDISGERVGFVLVALDKKRANTIAQGGENISFYLNMTQKELSSLSVDSEEKVPLKVQSTQIKTGEIR